jgi:hypothetical protein
MRRNECFLQLIKQPRTAIDAVATAQPGPWTEVRAIIAATKTKLEVRSRKLGGHVPKPALDELLHSVGSQELAGNLQLRCHLAFRHRLEAAIGVHEAPPGR